MRRRVYSLETEYAIAWVGQTLACTFTASELYDRLEPHILAHHAHARCDPTRGQAHGRGSPSSIQIELLEGCFLSNGARLYCDSGHLEWAAPETSDPYQAVLYDRAAELELRDALQAVQLDGRIMVVKNNLDYATDSTYGCHENYSIQKKSDSGRNVLNEIENRLLPFLVTRQIICGAGRLGSAVEPYVAFQLSQRADFTSTRSSVQTREDRPILNRRDEPLADGSRYERLHLILGDSNLSEYANFLKLGTTGILLDMVEADADLPQLNLRSPIQALHAVSRDLEFNTPLQLTTGSPATALHIQWAYWQAANAFLKNLPGTDPLANRILFLWADVLRAIEKQDPELESSLDWAGKRALLGRIVRELGSDWEELNAWEPILSVTWKFELSQIAIADLMVWLQRHLTRAEWDRLAQHAKQARLDWKDYPRIRRIAAVLRQQDILYHDIDPGHSLFYQSAEPFLLIEDEHAIETARQLPPGDTRAAVRSSAIRLAAERNLDIILDWHQIHMGGSNTTVSLPDPLSNDSSVLQKIFPGFFPARLHPARPTNPYHQDSSADEIMIDILSIEDLDPPTAKE